MHGCRLLIVIVATALASGCQLGRTMFQMDSNSNTPFLGVDLLGQNTTSPQNVRASSVTDLRNGHKEISSVKTVAQTDAPAKKKSRPLLERLKLKSPPEQIPLELTEPDSEITMGPQEEFQ